MNALTVLTLVRNCFWCALMYRFDEVPKAAIAIFICSYGCTDVECDAYSAFSISVLFPRSPPWLQLLKEGTARATNLRSAQLTAPWSSHQLSTAPCPSDNPKSWLASLTRLQLPRTESFPFPWHSLCLSKLLNLLLSKERWRDDVLSQDFFLPFCFKMENVCVRVHMFVCWRNCGLALVLLVTSFMGLGRSPALVLISTLKYRASDQLTLLQHFKIPCTTTSVSLKDNLLGFNVTL